ncbi:hypothetical protein evm_013803 [Chilo suppressalis]|nr:hypothetical protein evm_013803 [Chilo suppressalis]
MALATVPKYRRLIKNKTYIWQDSPDRQKLSVHVISMAEGGAGRDDSDNDKKPQKRDDNDRTPVVITDLVEFKSRRPLYPHPIPFTNIPRKGAHCKL